MGEITVRELRNHGGRVLERVERGETLVVTLDGRPVAELRPLPNRPLRAATLIRRWRGLPAIDATRLKRDIDQLMSPEI